MIDALFFSDRDWYRPYDLVTFNVTQDNYYDLIIQIYNLLVPWCTNEVDGWLVLPRQRYNQKPFRWLMVELLAAADDKIVLAIRQDNLYIAGFTDKSGLWYSFSNKVDLNLIPTAYGLEFADDYGSLVGGYRTLRQARFGRETTLRALHEIANYDPNSAADVGCISRAVAILAVTVCEGTRFIPISHSIRDRWEVGVDLRSLADYVVNWRKISCAVLISRQNNGVWGTNNQDDEARQLAHDLGIRNRGDALAVLHFMLWPSARSCSQAITWLK